MDKSKSIVPVEGITEKILILQNEKVLLDKDLAELYWVETRVLNQAVGRNNGRFPDDFMFELSREEIRSISQNVISSNIKLKKSQNEESVFRQKSQRQSIKLKGAHIFLTDN